MFPNFAITLPQSFFRLQKPQRLIWKFWIKHIVGYRDLEAYELSTFLSTYSLETKMECAFKNECINKISIVIEGLWNKVAVLRIDWTCNLWWNQYKSIIVYKIDIITNLQYKSTNDSHTLSAGTFNYCYSTVYRKVGAVYCHYCRPTVCSRAGFRSVSQLCTSP